MLVNGKPVGRTPTQTSLLAEKEHTIEFQLEGYESKNVMLNYHVGVRWVICDVLWALIPLIIDGATGAWYELDKNDIAVKLDKAR